MGTNTVAPTQPPETQDVIRTRELVLVDAEGRERARLGMSRPRGLFPTFEFMDRAGRPRLCICFRGELEIPEILFSDDLGRERLVVGLAEDQSWLIGAECDAEGSPNEVAVMEPQPHRAPAEEPTITPEHTLRGAGISSRRQALYQRRMSTLLGRPQLAGREGGA